MKDDVHDVALATEKRLDTYYTTTGKIHEFHLLTDKSSTILRRPIIISVSLFGAINTVLTILLVIFTQSWYNGIVFVTYTTLDILSGVFACKGVFVTEDFEPCTEVSFASVIQCCSGNAGLMRVSRWRVQKTWLVILLILFWLRPYALYMSILGLNGIGVSFIGANSCTHERFDSLSIYHPSGIFPTGQWLRYSRDQAYTFCTMDGRWGFPTYEDQFVRGYVRLPGTEYLNCAQESNPGFVALGNDPNSDDRFTYTQCTDAYPNPAFGVQGPVVLGTTNVSARLCPGNSNAPVCYMDDGTPFTCTTVTSTVTYPHSIGLPRKVCPVCLNYWRQRSGLFNDPPEYEHCPEYSATAPMPLQCAFCPGRGDGGLLTNERYSVDSLIIAFWLSTTITLFNFFLEFVLFYTLLHKAKKQNQITVKPNPEDDKKVN